MTQATRKPTSNNVETKITPKNHGKNQTPKKNEQQIRNLQMKGNKRANKRTQK